ncbi:MAG TPA: non-homologous end-joining DNA ligase [Solirubrobacteraceae bacterium]|jgi:bifunctional non-homologous end joining protein LigD|nr:non-homologous end-joining DNA ligase [Solirubrobacteraceae bacterium]
MTTELKVGRRDVKITHEDKIMFPEAGLTKLDVAGHYERAAPRMLPYVRDRPLALQAFPDGIEGDGFFLKAVPRYFPDWIKRATVPKKGGTITHALAQDAPTLVYLAGQNVVTVHTWLSRADKPHQPDRLTLDFDPSGGGFDEVRAAARAAGDRFRDLGLAPYAMTTGSRGVHVVCPLRRGPDFSVVHAFARALAEQMVADDPGHLTLEWHKTDRGKRIYVDVNRIAYAQHAVAPYSIRPRPTAPVAVPLHWDELSDKKLRPDGWTVKTVGERLDTADPWDGMRRHARALPKKL